MRLSLVRVLPVLAGVAALGLTVGAPLAAAAPPDAVSVSGIVVRNQHLVGLVSSSSGSAIDPSLDVIVAGKSHSVQAAASGAGSAVARTTVLTVDTSGSMGPAGMATVRSSVAAFLKGVPADVRVGVVSFAGAAVLNLPPTHDHAKVQSAVDKLTAKGETALYDAVSLAVKTAGGTGERSILVLSDGGDTASRSATRAGATAQLRAAGVRADAVSFKATDSKGNLAVLQGFASVGKGTVTAAADSRAVQDAFSSAARTLASQLEFSLPLPEGVSAVQNVKIAGTTNGEPFQVAALVDFGAGVSAPATPVAAAMQISGPRDETVRPSLLNSTIPVLGVTPVLGLALAGTFVGLLVLGIVLASSTFKSDRRSRVENIDRYVSAGTTLSKAKNARPSAVSENLVFLGERMMEGRESTNKTLSLIERADLPLRAGEWWVLRIVSVVAGTAFAVLMFRGGLLMTLGATLAGVVLGWFAPAAVLRFLASRRAKKFDSQLPDVLTLVASSLSTGFSLLQALDAVAKDAAEPAAKEFSRALAETRIGADVADSLERVADRMDSANMKWTSMAIRIQREVGGNLAGTLKTTAKTLREREELYRHVRALSAEGRLSAYILIALPIGIFFYTMQTNREYVELLWTRALGIGMLVAGVISLIVGMFWMRKVVDVKV